MLKDYLKVNLRKLLIQCKDQVIYYLLRVYTGEMLHIYRGETLTQQVTLQFFESTVRKMNILSYLVVLCMQVWFTLSENHKKVFLKHY